MKQENKNRLKKKIKSLLNFHTNIYIDWYEGRYPAGLDDMAEQMIENILEPGFVGIGKKAEGIMPEIETIIADQMEVKTRLERFWFWIWIKLIKRNK